jgi:hypothetical protein
MKKIADRMPAFLDELDGLEKTALSKLTRTAAFGARLAQELKVPGQVDSIARRLVDRKHPIYRTWPLRQIPVAALSKRASYDMEKEALLRDIGRRAVSFAKGIPGALRSIPGHAAGGAQNVGKAVGSFATPAKSMRAGWQKTVHDTKSMSMPMKALMGYGLVTGAGSVIKKDDPMGQGRSRVRRALAFAGDQAGMVMSAPFGFWGGTAGSMIGNKVGDTVGRAVDKVRGYRPSVRPDLPPPPTAGQG